MDLVSPDEVATLFNHTDSPLETYTATFFSFFTYIGPMSDLDTADKNETTYSEEMTAEEKEDSAREELLNEIVNVHEGRLFWDFCYILTGLLLLMIGLILYEIYMCRKMANGGQSNGVEPLVNTGFSSTIFTVGNEKTNTQKSNQ